MLSEPKTASMVVPFQVFAMHDKVPIPRHEVGELPDLAPTSVDNASVRQAESLKQPDDGPTEMPVYIRGV